jgi:translocation and assembly module TamA
MARRLATPVALAVAALAAQGCLWARGTAEEPIVTSFELEGVKAFDRDDVVEMLATRAPDLQLFPPQKLGYRLDPDALVVDARRVEAWYRERGYYAARVDRSEVIPDGRGRAKVILHVVEGEPVRVRSLEMPGLEGAPEARAKLGKPPLRVGQVFGEEAYDATRAAILRALRTTGWARAEVKQRARVLPEEGAAEVVYEVTTGPRLRFGPIFVAGTSAVPRELVRDQAAVELHPGDWFDVSRLELAQARVFQLGVFSGVRVTPVDPSAREDSVGVWVAVREAPFRTVRVGSGLGLEASRWEVRGLGGWTHRNFHGALRRLSLDLRAGYAWLPNPFNRQSEGTVGALTLEFSQPAAITRRVDASVRVEGERGIEQGYDFWAQRLQLGLPLRLAPRLTAVPSYNLEVYELSNTPAEVPGEDSLLENCPDTVCLLSYFEQRVAWDGRDNPVESHRGYYASLSVQEGIDPRGYGYRYLRFLPEVRGFLPLGPGSTLAARARLGALVPVKEEGDPPIVARFFSGGPTSMRGYTTRNLGPRDSSGNPVGGNGLAEGSVEVRQHLVGALTGVLFVDAGQVAGQGASPTAYREALSLSALEWAVGFGLRYATPFGPARVDVGLLPERFGDVNGISDLGTSFPGAVHISIGEAF